MALIIKACLVLSSLIGVASAISVPISMNSEGRSRTRRSLGDGSGRVGELISAKDQQNERGIHFEDLWSEIEQAYKKENKSIQDSIDTGKNELKKILDPGETQENKGELQEKQGKNCQGSEKIFCGYLVLKEKTNTDYKLQIVYNNKQSENKGEVKIVKKTSDLTSYYNKQSTSGITKSTPNLFEQLKGYGDTSYSNNETGTDISHLSIDSK